MEKYKGLKVEETESRIEVLFELECEWLEAHDTLLDRIESDGYDKFDCLVLMHLRSFKNENGTYTHYWVEESK